MPTFSCPFISITFMWSNIQICSHLLLPNYIWYIFYVHGKIGPKLSLQFPQQGKFFSAEISLKRTEDTFLFKTKDLLLQKVLINKFLEHDGMKVLSSALFSSCMIGIPCWQHFLDRNFYYYWEASLLWGKIDFFCEQTEKTPDVPDFFCVWH